MDDLSAPDGAATVVVTVAGSAMEAEMIVGMLRSNDLRAAIAHRGFRPDPTIQGVRVLVAPEDLEAARKLLAAVENS